MLQQPGHFPLLAVAASFMIWYALLSYYCTLMYPTELTTIAGGLSLYVPDPAAVQRIYTERTAAGEKIDFPFWARVWPSAEALIAFLAADPSLTTGKSVLELGAGIGAPGLSVAGRANNVLITDHSAEAVALLNKNIRHLELANVRSRVVDWRNMPGSLHADTVLLSDVNYEPTAFASLLSVIQEFIRNRATIVLATPQRITARAFTEPLEAFIRRSLVQHTEEGTEIGILVLAGTD